MQFEQSLLRSATYDPTTCHLFNQFGKQRDYIDSHLSNQATSQPPVADYPGPLP